MDLNKLFVGFDDINFDDLDKGETEDLAKKESPKVKDKTKDKAKELLNVKEAPKKSLMTPSPKITPTKTWKYSNKDGSFFYNFSPDLQKRLTQSYNELKEYYIFKLNNTNYIIFFKTFNQISENGIIRKIKYD